MLAESYNVSLCGVRSVAEAIGLYHDAVAIERPIPNVCEGASTVREGVEDLYVP